MKNSPFLGYIKEARKNYIHKLKDIIFSIFIIFNLKKDFKLS
jgi:hypothetical protein